ncbi:MAG: alanyl-tRNA editing protein [Bacillota bacterium]
MTKKLYYDNAFQQEFSADIKSYQERDDLYYLVLNQTAFYPEGGGQPADRGYIGSSRVQHVFSQEGEVYHVVETLPEEQTNLTCQLNWERRFDHMQQHTGQHLLSAVLWNLNKAATIGFHLGEENLTIDLDKELREEQLNEVEARVNEVIYQNREIGIEYPDEEKLEERDLRKVPSVNEDVRLIKIEGLDLTPCGGTHLQQTGQLGIISIIGNEKYKGGSRLSFLCGRRAREDYRYKNEVLADLRKKLSANNQNIIDEVTRLQAELTEQDERLSQVQARFRVLKAKSLLNSAVKLNGYNLIKTELPPETSVELKELALELTAGENIIAILGQREAGTVRLTLASSENISSLNMNQILQQIMPMLQGGGGGHHHLAQGGGSKAEMLPDAMQQAQELIRTSLSI